MSSLTHFFFFSFVYFWFLFLFFFFFFKIFFQFWFDLIYILCSQIRLHWLVGFSLWRHRPERIVVHRILTENLLLLLLTIRVHHRVLSQTGRWFLDLVRLQRLHIMETVVDLVLDRWYLVEGVRIQYTMEVEVMVVTVRRLGLFLMIWLLSPWMSWGMGIAFRSRFGFGLWGKWRDRRALNQIRDWF